MATTQSYKYSLPAVVGQALTDLLRFQLLEKERVRLRREQKLRKRELEKLEERFLQNGSLARRGKT